MRSKSFFFATDQNEKQCGADKEGMEEFVVHEKCGLLLYSLNVDKQLSFVGVLHQQITVRAED
jgi:hypothetical protein